MGFIGSNLAIRLVSEGAHVTLVDSLIGEHGGNPFNIETIRDSVTIDNSDIRDEKAISLLVRDKDYLFNLAGQTSHLDSMQHPLTDLDLNARAQLSTLEACRKYNPKIKIVFAGTRQVYGKPQYFPVDELHPLAPVDINGINKLAGEYYHLLYHETYGIRSVVLRLTNTYGPRMRVVDARQTFLGIWIRNLIDGNHLQVYGDGKQLRDFNFIDDTIDAMISAATCDAADGNIYNLGSSERVNLKSLAELMIGIFGSGHFQVVPFPEDRKRIDIGDYYADYQRASKELSWSPQVSLTAGLQQTLDYYQRFGQKHYW